MNTAQLTALIAAAVTAAMSAQMTKPKASGHKAISTYKPKNKFTPKGKVLSEGMTERQLSNDVKVAKAFKNKGFLVTPRVDALTYKGWLSKGMRVVPGQHGLFVKGVGTLFHSGQVATDIQPSKAEMSAETAKITAAHASFPA